MSVSTARPKVNLKTIALPASHGGWGFLLEPMVLGLWVAPSVAGVWLAMAATGVFLAQQPLRLAVADRLKRRRYPRTAWAERLALIYLSAAVIGLGVATLTADAGFWLPLLLATPPALIQFAFDTRNRGRELLPELAGAGALGGWPRQLQWLPAGRP
jgi:hypothetical protein